MSACDNFNNYKVDPNIYLVVASTGVILHNIIPLSPFHHLTIGHDKTPSIHGRYFMDASCCQP